MRLIRWVIGGVVVVGALALTGAVLLHPGMVSCDDSFTGPSSAFVGEVTAKEGSDVTFRVDEVLSDQVFHDFTTVEVAVGDEVVVHYVGGDERFVHRGQRYQVYAWGQVPDDLASGVHTAGECQGAGEGTRHADGSTIDTGLFTRDGVEPYLRPVGLGLLLIAAVAGAVVAYRRVKHPRLTIDGQPRR